MEPDGLRAGVWSLLAEEMHTFIAHSRIHTHACLHTRNTHTHTHTQCQAHCPMVSHCSGHGIAQSRSDTFPLVGRVPLRRLSREMTADLRGNVKKAKRSVAAVWLLCSILPQKSHISLPHSFPLMSPAPGEEVR